MKSSPELAALVESISSALAKKPEHFVKHPAEMKILQEMSDDELRDFAHEHGWSVVRRLGGLQIEFYNDHTQQRPADDNER